MEKEINRKLLLGQLGEILENGKFDFQIIQDDIKIEIETIEYGLISCFSTWSGFTYGFGKIMLNQISEGAKNKIPFKLLDSDFISLKIQKKLFDSYKWGYFESCWVEQGTIKKRYKFKEEFKPFIEYVQERVSEIENYEK